MLKKAEKYIYICVLVVSLFIVTLCMFADIKNLLEQHQAKMQEAISKDATIKNIELIGQIKSTKGQEQIKHPKEEESKINIYSTNPWRIKIPKLRLDAPIAEGTSAEALRRTVGHFEETGKWKGNVCLAGHNRGYRCNFFQEIKNLQKGDIIIYCTEEGERKYQVVVNTVIQETDWTYLNDTKDNRITLITCEMNQREYRRCIQAVEMKNL